MTTPLLGPTVLAETRIADRLNTEPILWLTTVSDDRRPHSVPVWFCWTDPCLTLFSQPDSAKIRRLRRNPAVSISLDSAQQGTDIVLGEGDAELVEPATVAHILPDLERKYRPMLANQSIEQWCATFSQPIVVTLSKIIAWTRTSEGLDYRSIQPPPS